MTLRRPHACNLLCLEALWGLWGACAVVWALLFSTPALATPSGQECVDIEALGNLTLTEDGRRRAAELVRQGDPAREFLCVELGWDCVNDPSYQVLVTEATSESRPSLPSDDPTCAGSSSADESRCEDPGSAAAWASVIDLLLDEPQPVRPVLLYGPACYDNPTLCSGLPPAPSWTPLTANPVPVLPRLECAFCPAETSRPGRWSAPQVRNAHAGPGAASGVHRRIERPPQT